MLQGVDVQLQSVKICFMLLSMDGPEFLQKLHKIMIKLQVFFFSERELLNDSSL